ncbi:MAG: branched-chain amino acid transaminase [Polyangia bacterium]
MSPPNYAFFDGRIVPYGEAKVGVLTHALNYGTAAFGGLRAYWNEAENQLYLFRPLDHFRRFLQSAKLLTMTVPYTAEELTQHTLELLRREGLRTDSYIRPLLFAADELVGVRLHDLRTSVSIVALPFGAYIAKSDGAHACFSSWRRLDDNMIPARGKIAGAYVNSALAKSEAVRGGFDEALFLTADGHVSEASAANIFLLRDGVAYTPPITDDVLEGITRRTMMTLMRDEMGVQVEERRIDRTQVFLADEVFLVGSGVQIAAVTRVEHRAIGSGTMGPVTRGLKDRFNAVVRGQDAKYRSFLHPVYPAASQAG